MGLGGCLCFKPSSSFHGIRVVHLNGFVEEFHDPITVSELIGAGRPPKSFVSTSSQLLSINSSSKDLPLATQLQQGRVYFLLPFSVLESQTSPIDLIYLSNRLTAEAKRFGSKAKSSKAKSSKKIDPLLDPVVSKGRTNSTTMRVDPFSLSKRRSKSTRAMDYPSLKLERSNSTPARVGSIWEHVKSSVAHEDSTVEVSGDHELSCRFKSWKPILETIIERSFGRRSETSFSHGSESFRLLEYKV